MRTSYETTPSPRILLVDDDESVRRCCASELNHSGYEVETAEDGEAAWSALQTNAYDLLITDNRMPRLSGVELIERVYLADMGLPVILMSGTLPTDPLRVIQALQIAATLRKPFDVDQLLVVVKETLCTAESLRTR